MEEKDLQQAEACTCEETCECEDTCVEEEQVEEKKAGLFSKKKKIEELEAKVASLEEELAKSKNDYLKAYADTENLKRRLNAEALNVKKYRIQGFALEILPILDNLERALKVQSDDENLKNYVKGFEMIYQQLIATLEKEGVTEIEALDKPFDPNVHQALMQEAVEGVESGMVVEVLQKGYMLKDRVLRATLVKVSE